MIADFVSKRGGGLLMLGGRRSFAEGGWAGTPVGEVLPVILPTPGQPARHVLLGADGPADARRRDQPGHADRRRRGGIRETLERPAAGHDGQSGARRQAGRHGPAVGARQHKTGSGRAGVPALRPRQGARAADSGFVAVAHEREASRSPTRPTRRSGVASRAGWSTTSPTRSC